MTKLAKIPAQVPVEGPGSAGLLAALGLHGLVGFLP